MQPQKRLIRDGPPVSLFETAGTKIHVDSLDNPYAEHGV